MKDIRDMEAEAARLNGLPEDEAASEALQLHIYRASLGLAPGSKALVDVVGERLRQAQVENWSFTHDDAHPDGALALAAAAYAVHAAHQAQPRLGLAAWVEKLWPWAERWWKPADPRRDLVKAGALIFAEIERLDRAAK